MSAEQNQTIVVTGATGLQGGAVARQLLADGWRVRALTRKPQSPKAQALADLGAEVVQGDMAERDSLFPIFEGAYGIYSVQNPVPGGVEGEISQGKNVAAVANQVGVRHLVYGSAGLGIKGTGVPSWESKLVIEDYMKSLALPLTVFRPMAFMELMTEKKFYPAVSTWNIMPRLMGSATEIGWLCTEDLAVIVGRAFAEPEQYIGKELRLSADVQSHDHTRAIYRSVMGKNPPRFPMPLWMYERYGFIGQDTCTMWRWLRTADVEFDPEATRAIHPGAMTVQAWLEKQNRPKFSGATTGRLTRRTASR